MEQKHPWAKLARSRKFWLLILDTVVSIALHLWTGEDATFYVATMQPVFLLVILSVTHEDVTAIKAGTHPAHKAVE